MKKLLVIALATALCFTTGCGKKQDKNSADESTTIETSTEETTDETSTETEETTVEEETKAKNVENEVNITVQLLLKQIRQLVRPIRIILKSNRLLKTILSLMPLVLLYRM